MRTLRYLPYAIMGLVLLGVANLSFAAQKQITLQFASQFVATHKMSLMNEQWIKEVEKRTGGAIKILYHPGGTLVDPAQTYDAVVKGIIDIGQSSPGFEKGRFPLSEIFDLPIGIASDSLAVKLFDQYFEKFKPKEFNDTKILYFFGHSSAIFHTKKPVHNLEELRGVKIRAAGVLPGFVSLMGAVPVSMPMGEAYEALQKGAAEGIIAPYEALEGFRIAEVINYSTENLGTIDANIQFTNMNKGVWDSFSPDIKKVIDDLNKEWAPKVGKLWDEMELSGKNFSLKRGNKIITLTPAEDKRWVERAKPILTQYVTNGKAKGIPAEEVLKFIDDFKKQYQK